MWCIGRNPWDDQHLSFLPQCCLACPLAVHPYVSTNPPHLALVICQEWPSSQPTGMRLSNSEISGNPPKAECLTISCAHKGWASITVCCSSQPASSSGRSEDIQG